MEPVKLDIIIWQGSTWEKTFIFSKNGAAWPDGTILARAQIRDTEFDVKLADFDCSVVTAAAGNTVTIALTATITAGIEPGKGVWDFELYRDSDGYVWKPFYGGVTIKAEATK